jgi:hypothetical protein
MRLIAIAVVLALDLAACATSYQPAGFFSGGFTDSQLDKDVFRVSFSGNEYTSAEEANEMALLRSAELALKNGFTHFTLIDERSRTQYSSYTTPIRSTTTGSSSFSGNSVNGNSTQIITGGQTHVYAMPNDTMTIKCFDGKPAAANGMVYDARFVFNSLGQKYGATAPK